MKVSSGFSRTASSARAATAPRDSGGGAGGKSTKETVLVVDDEPGILSALAFQLGRSYELVTRESPEEAVELLRSREVAVIVSDQRMPGMSGAELLEEAARTQPDAARILLTGYSDLAAVIDAVNRGQIHFYLTKPWRPLELEAVIGRGVERWRLVREKERLLATLRERTAALEESNAELQGFAYAMAHDLKQPLRAMDGFAALLAEELEGSLSDTAGSHLERIRAGASRLAVLTDGLQRMAWVAGCLPRPVPIDLANLAREVVARLRAADPGRSVEVVLPDSLPVLADPALTHVVLEALLENAWKFTAPVPEPRIELAVESSAGDVVFVVRDNGVGFDETYAHKLFGPFQRLHPAAGFEGEGIGLALVSRAVRRQGGRVWASGTPSEGASFSFTLPGGAQTPAVGDVRR